MSVSDPGVEIDQPLHGCAVTCPHRSRYPQSTFSMASERISSYCVGTAEPGAPQRHPPQTGPFSPL
jgi:hypothetical protein